MSGPFSRVATAAAPKGRKRRAARGPAKRSFVSFCFVFDFFPPRARAHCPFGNDSKMQQRERDASLPACLAFPWLLPAAIALQIIRPLRLQKNDAGQLIHPLFLFFLIFIFKGEL